MNKHPVLLLSVLFASFFGARSILASESVPPDLHSETRTLTIQDAVRMTLTRAPDVLIAEAQAARAREAVRESRSLNRPQLVAGTGLAYNNGYPLSMEGAAPSIVQVGLSQSIFSRKNRNLIREAEEAGKASQFAIDSARNELASRTALAYFELFQARRLAAIAFARLDEALAKQRTTEALFDAGRALPVDLTLSRTAASSARQLLLEAQEHARLAEAELRELTGLQDGISINTVEPAIESPAFESPAEVLYQRALERTPEILQAEAEVKSKEFRFEAEKGESGPRLDVVSQYALFSRTNNYADFFNRFERHNFLLGLSVQMPILDGSRTSSRVAQSRQEMTEARYRLQRVKSDLKMAIERASSALRIAASACDQTRSEVDAVRENVQVHEALLEHGRISAGELQDLRIQLHQKQIAQLQAEQVLFQCKVNLLRTIGVLPSVLQ